MTQHARRFAATSAALLALSSGCGSPELPRTQVVVSVDGDPEVLEQLRRVRAHVYASDATDGALPLATHEFALTTRLDAGVGEVDTPFSFSVARGEAPRFRLVVEGLRADESDAGETPAVLVEAKSLVTFTPDRTLAVRVYLAGACFGLVNPCTSMAETCYPAARACGPVEDAGGDLVRPGAETFDAGTPTASSRDPQCPLANRCSADYPCVGTPPSGYVCLGQRADWPVAIAGTARAPSFDVSTDPDLVVDRATGLAWQRARPERYAGCTRGRSVAGDLCDWNEAKIYCSRLTLAGRAWRLPSKAELETLLELDGSTPTIAREVFPGTLAGPYWSSSPNPHGRLADLGYFNMWKVDFGTGMSGFLHPEELMAVRCVSGTPVGSADARYRTDEAADTISDPRTSLTWARSELREIATLADAQRACAERGEGFRVPHVRELLTIHDPTRNAPALIPGFREPASMFAWATAARADGTLDPWYVDAVFGASYALQRPGVRSILAAFPPSAPHVRCVR